MNTLTTNGVKISVESFYQPAHSNPAEFKFVFAYRITITNERPTTVQLLRRHWMIKDSSGNLREVKGDGVIGQQPIIKPGDSHQYVSWAPLETEIGKMYGSYQMFDVDEESHFDVRIPVFNLIAPFKLN